MILHNLCRLGQQEVTLTLRLLDRKRAIPETLQLELALSCCNGDRGVWMATACSASYAVEYADWRIDRA